MAVSMIIYKVQQFESLINELSILYSSNGRF